MTLKKVLLIPLVASFLLFVLFSPEIAKSFSLIEQTLPLTPQFMLITVIAIILQMVGHWIRAYKMRYTLSPIKQSTTKFQFRALSLGYLFNTVLPLRIGEIVRSYVIASAERVSWGLSLALILFERSVDALVLLLVIILLAILGWIGGPAVWLIAILLAVFVAIVLVGIWMSIKENRFLISLINRASGLFNDTIQHRFRFKIWSVIYGLQRTLVGQRRLIRYLSLSLASWMFYAVSVALFVAQFAAITGNPRSIVLGAASPYISIAIPAGPAGLGAYSAAAGAIGAQIPLTPEQRVVVVLASWAVVTIPICIVAMVLLFVKTNEPFRRKLKPKASSRLSLIDKLARDEDISDDMGTFLSNYFAGNPLSRIVHKLEREGSLHLLKYFKGGSDAITILVAGDDGRVVVKKIIAIEYKERLKAQYDWLMRHQGAGVVRVLHEETSNNYYAIDLEYDESNEMFFDYLHRNSAEENERVMREVWATLYDTLYLKTTTVTDFDALDAYVEKHIWGCLRQAGEADSTIVAATRPQKIRINGKDYDNIKEIMKKIMANKKARKDLATFARAGEVDGDIALDNILVSKKTGRPLIIDPAPDGNIINGPVFDFGKNMQSLYCGYEFLFRSEEKVILENENEINFQDRRSGQYIELCKYVRGTLAPKYLSEGEQKAIIFHAAALHIRRLKHQVQQNQNIALAMYAVGIRTLNEFLEQY